MINLFLHHLNACKVKLRLHLRGTKEKSFEINKAEPPDNWNFILLFGTAYRFKKYRICQQKEWKLQYLTTRNGKHRYLSWKRFFYMYKSWGIAEAKSLSTRLDPDRRHQHHHPHLQDLLHCSCTLQSKCKLLCKASHCRHTSIASFGKCCGIHSKLIPSRPVELAPGQSKRSQGILPSVAIHGLPALGQFLAVRLSSREKLDSWLA